MKNKELIRSFVTSISMGVVIVGASKLLNFILKVLVSRLGVADFGDYYLATSTFLGLTTIAALGIPMSTTRFISYLKGKKQSQTVEGVISSSITVITASSVFIGVLLYTQTEAIATLLGTPQASQYLRILAFGLIGSTMTLLARAVFLGHMRIDLAYMTEAVEIGLKFLFTISGMVLLRLGVVGALIGYTAGTLFGALFNTIRFIKVSGIKHFTPQVSRGFLRFALPVSASEIVTAAANIVLLYIVRVMGGAETIGYYAAAVSIAALIHVVPQMVLSVFLPTASEAYAQKIPVFSIYKTLMAWLSVVVLLPSVCIIGFSQQITALLFGSTYSASALILPTLTAAYALYALIAWPNRQLLDMAGYTKENLMLTVFRTFISVSALLFIIQDYSGTGLAMAILWGWGGEAIGSLVVVKLKKLL